MCSVVLLTFVCTVVAVFGLASAVPTQQQQQHEEVTGGYTSIFWSVMDDCFGDGENVPESTTVCLKSKALTALDRALSKPSVTIVDGVSLTARTGKSLQIDLQQADRADRAALDAAKDSDQKNALLDEMLASRVDQFVSTRTIVMDAPADQEGRGKKKKDKSMKKAMMMMGMMMAAVMGPMAMKMIGMMSMKALVVGKIALVLSLIMLFKKLMSKQKQGGGNSHEAESEQSSYSSYGRSMQIDAHNMAYSGQKQ